MGYDLIGLHTYIVHVDARVSSFRGYVERFEICD